ncbi:DUF1983 domain-containing protein [Aeromonas salmonicida]|uniref:phage tail tip fiber protein n=1 Tax=Aeromonas salmonicida TaxID=645 RepID=UPI003D05956F
MTITEQTQALSQLDGQVSALKTIKLDVNGKVSGLQMGNDGTTSTFDVLADVFRVSHGTSSQSVFEIRDSKTYIKNAMIGDLTASSLRANSITGNEINSNSIIVAGSGATSATLNGSDPTWRIYAGSTTPASAPFRVTGSGQLVATNANITGAITATSGSFTGAISASSGAISGRLSMSGGFIDGRSGQDSINLGNGSFRVDNAGNLYASNGSFGGIIYADKIIGDITNMGVINYPVVNSNAPEGYIESGQQKVLFRMNLSPVNFTRMINISAIPFTWSALENGGYFYIYLRDSTGRSTTLFESGVGSGIFNPYDFTDFIVELPANASWWQIVLTGNRKSRIHRNSTARAFWSSFKKGSGDVSLSHF